MSWFTVSGWLLEAEQSIHLHVELVIVSNKPVWALSAVWVYWFSYKVQLKPNPKLTVVYVHYMDKRCTNVAGLLCTVAKQYREQSLLLLEVTMNAAQGSGLH